ncbi:MAG: RecX family transcriptional regulator, partial [Lentisphaeria bacterium]|nr:RecX family transcriptional regulator [Lentisphaeria bacterium]
AEKALQGRMRILRNEPDPRKRREKALRFLAGRGFDVRTCFAAVDKFLVKDGGFDFFS